MMCEWYLNKAVNNSLTNSRILIHSNYWSYKHIDTYTELFLVFKFGKNVSRY